VTNVLDLFRLDGKVAVVTGASSGLGAGFSLALAQAGADIVLAARRTDRLHEVAKQIEDLGRRALPAGVDITDPDGCEAMASNAMAEFGRIDILVNNAGVGTAVSALRETPEQFRQVVDINLNGLYWAAQACGRVMEPGSSIVNISSVLALIKSYAPQAAYSASKAGVLGLTRDLAQQDDGPNPGRHAASLRPAAQPARPAGPAARTRRRRRVPGQSRLFLHHRHHPGRRRRHVRSLSRPRAKQVRNRRRRVSGRSGRQSRAPTSSSRPLTS
jgi:NAD(P)-dependent dehydrogenase (short-subunit alcohol dehydrogenase family)